MSCNFRWILVATFTVILNGKFLFISANDQNGLNYQEIISLGASCSSSDSCSISREISDDNLIFQTCECKPSCAKYNTCCIDSPDIPTEERRAETEDFPEGVADESCLNLGGAFTFYVMAVDKCKPNWSGNSELRALCETQNSANLKDPIALLPVINPISAITYRNYFCALCNDAEEKELKFWNIIIQVNNTHEGNLLFQEFSSNDLTTQDILQRLFYNEEKNQWGFMVDSTSGSTFQGASLNFGQPFALYEKIHHCHPNLVSSCSLAWQDDVVKRKCAAYMGMVYANLYDSATDITKYDVRFRNIHCAICNFASYESGKVCYPSHDLERQAAGPSLAFSVTVDFKLSDGVREGEVDSCQKGELYDPFLKSCRSFSVH